MIKVGNGTFPFYQFEIFADCVGLKHFVSSGEKSIGFVDEKAHVTIQRYRRELAEAVGFNTDCLVTGQQVHSAHIESVTFKDKGRGAMEKESRLPETDALVTDEEEICLMVLSADCVPIILYDSVRQVIAAIHAGWRGTVARIVMETVQMMQTKFQCSPENILAGIGPSIGKCCFEVGAEVAQAFGSVFPLTEHIIYESKKSGKYLIDLWEANRRQLLETGVQYEHIEVAGMCTVCHPDHFFSYRRDGERAGRFGAGIMLKKRI